MRFPRLTKLILGGALALGACSTPPKPAELEAFERLRADPQVPMAEKRAPELMSRADQLLSKAREEWEDGDLEDAKNAALMGQIKLKQALALAEQERAKARIRQATTDLAVSQEELARLNRELTLTQDALGSAKRYQEADEEKRKLEAQRQEEQKRAEAERQLAELKTGAIEKIKSAELGIREATAVNASKFAAVPFGSAQDMLTRAQKEFGEQNFRAAQISAEQSLAKAKEAAEAARPQYQKEADTAASAVQAEALARDAASMTRFEVRRDARGSLQRLVLHIPSALLFKKPKDTVMAPGADSMLQGVAEVANKYPNFRMQVVGHAGQRGKPDALLALSLARAQAVFSALVSRNVDSKRMIVSGQGAGEPIGGTRCAAERARNDRVEVIFLYQ